MSKRTSIPEILARFWVVAFLFALFPYGLVAVLGGAISLGFLAFIALLVTFFFNGLQWAGHRALFGGTPEYEELRANGKDAWFDVSCPPPFRPESLKDDGPAIHFYCNNCGTEAFDLDAPCRNCGFEQYECPACGGPVKNEFAVCPRCGNDPRQYGTCLFPRPRRVITHGTRPHCRPA